MRKYPEFADEFLPTVGKIALDQIEDTEGKTAFVWLIGQFCDQIEDAPYILEKMIMSPEEL